MWSAHSACERRVVHQLAGNTYKYRILHHTAALTGVFTAQQLLSYKLPGIFCKPFPGLTGKPVGCNANIQTGVFLVWISNKLDVVSLILLAGVFYRYHAYVTVCGYHITFLKARISVGRHMACSP